MTSPKRRWFQWSLRTMFVVVTLFGCWLGWNVNAVQGRKRLINWADSHGVKLNRDGTWDRAPPAMIAAMKASKQGPAAITRRPPQAIGISWLRQRVLGDCAIECIWIPHIWRNEAEARQIDAAFPGAKIIVGADDWH